MLALGIIAPVFPKLVIQLEGGNEASAAGMVEIGRASCRERV